MICVDASVVAQWLLVETYSEAVEDLFASTTAQAEPLVASPMLPFEIANILRKQVIRKNLTHSNAEYLLTQYDTLPITIHRPRTLHRMSLALADQYGLPAIYDATYLAVAQTLSCDFWTDDQTLLRTLNGQLPFVRWIGDFVSPSNTPGS